MVIGGGGMAIDFAQFYLWKRELQFANDQAAIAAAIAEALDRLAARDDDIARTLIEVGYPEPRVRGSRWAEPISGRPTIWRCGSPCII